jgi:hypothetical protein
MDSVPVPVLSRLVDYDHSVGGLINQLSTQTTGSFSRKRALGLEYIHSIKEILRCISNPKHLTNPEEGMVVNICHSYEQRELPLIDNITDFEWLLTYFQNNSYGSFDQIVSNPGPVILVYTITLAILLTKIRDNKIYNYLIIELFIQMNERNLLHFDTEILSDDIFNTVGMQEDSMIGLVASIKTEHEFLCVFRYVNEKFFRDVSAVLLMSEVVGKIRELGLNNDIVYQGIMLLFGKHVYDVYYSRETDHTTFKQIQIECVNELAKLRINE